MVSALDLSTYLARLAGGPSLIAEAILERCALLLVLAWMCLMGRALVPAPMPSRRFPQAEGLRLWRGIGTPVAMGMAQEGSRSCPRHASRSP
jgi:hypothetical protein